MGSTEQGVTSLALPSLRRRATGLQLRHYTLYQKMILMSSWIRLTYRLLNVFELWVWSVDFVQQTVVVVQSVARNGPHFSTILVDLLERQLASQLLIHSSQLPCKGSLPFGKHCFTHTNFAPLHMLTLKMMFSVANSNCLAQYSL